MARSRRHRSQLPFASLGHMRALSMVGMLFVLWMLFERAADPHTWAWLGTLDEPRSANEFVSPGGKLPANSGPPLVSQETVIATPGADDPEEADAAREEYQALADRAPLDGVEMSAYWRQMRWSRGLTFAEMEQSARRDVLFTQLWEEPEKYRGQLIRLRLHVKRALTHEAPQNSAGVKRVYEAWGWTEESRSFPYLVVFSELPPQMPLGPDIHEEAVFVGYFLKQMSYQAYDNARAAPLLIGRLHWQPNPARIALEKSRGGGNFWPTALAGGVAVLAIVGSWIWKRRRRRHGVRLPQAEASLAGNQWWQQVQDGMEESRGGEEADEIFPSRSRRV